MSALIVTKDTIDLIMTAVIMAGLRGDREIPSAASMQQVATADKMGRRLWMCNVEAANLANGTDEPTPDYEWRPILELMELSLEPTQLIQIEKSRRYLVEQCQGHPDWATSSARRLLEVLKAAIKIGLEGWPTTTTAESPDRSDYVGICAAVPAWTREHGFPALRHSDQAGG